jgi:hypothetical protein
MKKYLLFILTLFLSASIFCQTPANSFEYHAHGSIQTFTQNQIDTFISRSNLEGFRLLDQRVTLTFDNGFDIILLSAKELQQLGMLSNTASYQATFPGDFTLPKFHLNPNGQIAAEYPTNKKFKHSTGNR